MPETELAASDMAILNLACADGLPGSDALDLTSCLARLSTWARHVKREIKRNWHRHVRDSQHNGYSIAQWQIAMMITVLQQDCGVRYNPNRIYSPDFTDSRDQFIHGILYGDGGTCASMPVLYVAIGRRLDFPLRLVAAKAHLFARWDSPTERFNIEGSGRGISFFPDEHYYRWPLELAAAEIASGSYLCSFRPQKELAAFLAARGHCLHDNLRFDEASEAYKAAYELSPTSPHYHAFYLLAEACAGRPANNRLAYAAEKDLGRINSTLSKGKWPCTMPS